jgi:protease-4
VRRRKRWIILALIVVVVLGGIVLSKREPYIAPGSFLEVDISGSYAEAPPADLVGQLVGSQHPLLADLLLELRKAAADTRLQGVLLKVAPLELDFAQIQEIRAALQALKATGKQVIAWVSGEGDSGNREYYLASAAHQVHFTPNTVLPLLGLRATAVFLGGVWEKLGIVMQVEQIREFKTFGDMLARKTMSEAHREMTNSLLDSLQEQFLTAIAEARGLTPAQVQAFIDTPILTAADYQRAGLIDGIQFYDDLRKGLSPDPERPVSTVSLTNYQRVKASSVGLKPGPTMAVIYGVGAVTNGDSSWGATGQAMGADTMIEALEEAAQDQTIAAIIFRVDSPGGSALASDLIWQAVVAAKKRKPVVVSMSGVAASGGYYVATGATKIVAQPATLTGSIGIVFSLPNIQGLLDKLGVHMETLDRGRYARLFDPAEEWTPEERQQVQRLLETLYSTFTRRVAEGRGLSTEEVDRIGRGRVWTGAQAVSRGLVDQLGGMETALQIAKEEAGFPAEASVRLVFYPKEKPLLETLLRRLSRQESFFASFVPQPVQEVVELFAPLARQGQKPLFVMPLLIRIR